MSAIFLSVVIPSYNETANLKRGVLDEVNNYLQKQNYSWEVLVSDDGSPEIESRKLAEDFCSSHKGFRFLQNDHGGKPVAIWTGIKASVGEIVLFSDMDQSTPIREVEKLLPEFNDGFDVVIGSRGIERENAPLIRRLASLIFREFRRSLVLTEIIDSQAGFKAFRRDAIMEIFPLLDAVKQKKRPTGWNPTSFDVELLVAAKRRGYKISEIQIDWKDRDVSTGKARGTKKLARESWEMMKETFRVKLSDMQGFYSK